MNILALIGSRNPTGQTARAADALLNAAEAQGARVERVFLPTLKIERCKQCNDKGWGLCMTNGACIIEDDFPALTDKLRAADALVLATPVYFSDLSESLRGYLDRLRRIGRHADGKKGVELKPAIGICVAGGGGGGHMRCADNMDKIFKNIGLDVLDIIPIRRQNLEMKCETLAITGRWFVQQMPGVKAP